MMDAPDDVDPAELRAEARRKNMSGLTVVLTVAAMIFTLILITCIAPVPASAHDHWINHGGFTVPATAPAFPYTGPTQCCGQSDCKVVNPLDLEVRGASFYIKSLGETIPMSEVKWNSPDGQYYRCQDNATLKRKCFFAPQPST